MFILGRLTLGSPAAHCTPTDRRVAVLEFKNASTEREFDRLTALYILLSTYGGTKSTYSYRDDSFSPEPSPLSMRMDQFAADRMRDVLAARYWQEIQTTALLAPLTYTTNAVMRYAAYNNSCTHLEINLPQFLSGFLKARKCLLGEELTKDERRKHELQVVEEANIGSQNEHFARWLHLDTTQEVAFYHRLTELCQRWDPEKKWRREQWQRLGQVSQKILDLDRSTLALQEALKYYAADELPAAVEQATKEIEINQIMARLLSGPDRKRVRRCWFGQQGLWVRIDRNRHSPPAGLIYDYLKNSSCEKRNHLFSENEERRVEVPGFRISAYLLSGDLPVWEVSNSESGLETDEQEDLWRAPVIRRLDGASHQSLLAVVEGVERRDLQLRFDLSDSAAQPLPDLGIVFSLHNVLHPTAAMHGHAIVLSGGRLELVELEVPERPQGFQARYQSENPYVLKTLAEQAAPTEGMKQLRLVFQAMGENLEIGINGKSFSFKSPPRVSGFYGILFHKGRSGYPSRNAGITIQNLAISDPTPKPGPPPPPAP